MAFGGAATPTTNRMAFDALENASIGFGFTPNSALDPEGVRDAILANALTTIPGIKVRTASVNLGNLNQDLTAEQDITVTGVAATDVCIHVEATSALNAGLGIGDFRVKAANTITVRYFNVTGAPIDAGAATWTFVTITP